MGSVAVSVAPLARLRSRRPVPGHPGLLLATGDPSRRLLAAAEQAVGAGPLRVMRSAREILAWLAEDPDAGVVAGRDLWARALHDELAHAANPVAVVSLVPAPLAAFVLDPTELDGPTLRVALRAARVIAATRAEARRERERAEGLAARLADLRAIDPLTECASRQATLDAVQRAADHARATGRIGGFALVRVDLPTLDRLATDHGERHANLIVALVARRMEECTRQGDLIGRVGETSLVVLVRRMRAPDAAREVAERAERALAQLSGLAGEPIPLRARVGWVAGGPHMARAEEFLRAARAIE